MLIALTKLVRGLAHTNELAPLARGLDLPHGVVMAIVSSTSVDEFVRTTTNPRTGLADAMRMPKDLLDVVTGFVKLAHGSRGTILKYWGDDHKIQAVRQVRSLAASKTSAAFLKYWRLLVRGLVKDSRAGLRTGIPLAVVAKLFTQPLGAQLAVELAARLGMNTNDFVGRALDEVAAAMVSVVGSAGAVQ